MCVPIFNSIHPIILVSIHCGVMWPKEFGLVANTLDCDIVVREFKLQLGYYIHFETNILGKGTNPHILPAMGLSLMFFYKDGFGII